VQQTFRSYNILIVEDSPGDAGLIREAFADCGEAYSLIFAANTQAARDLLNKENFDLILWDMSFSNEEGADFIRQIRADARLKSLPVIVLSGTPNPRLAYEAGANAFVSKSMDLDSFFAKIKALMHFWVEIVELPRVPGPDELTSVTR
jgi:CheY-like chemotaxis protein